MSLFKPRLMTFLESRISNAAENGSFAVSFISLELRESKDCMKAGEGKARDS